MSADCQTCGGRRCPVSILPSGCAFHAGHQGDHLTPREVDGYRTACPTCGFDPMADHPNADALDAAAAPSLRDPGEAFDRLTKFGAHPLSETGLPLTRDEYVAARLAIVDAAGAAWRDELYLLFHATVERLNVASGIAHRLGPADSPFTVSDLAYLELANDLVRHVGRRVRPESETFAKATDEVSKVQVLARHTEAVRQALGVPQVKVVARLDGQQVLAGHSELYTNRTPRP